MSLQGTIETFAIADVLRLLAATNKSGRLQVQGVSRAGTVWVDSGKVLAAESPNTPHERATCRRRVPAVADRPGLVPLRARPRTRPSRESPWRSRRRSATPRACSASGGSSSGSFPPSTPGSSLRSELREPSVTVSAEQWKTIGAVAGGRTVAALGDSLGTGELATVRSVSQLVDLGLVDIEDTPGEAEEAAPRRRHRGPDRGARHDRRGPRARPGRPRRPADGEEGEARRRLDALASSIGLPPTPSGAGDPSPWSAGSAGAPPVAGGDPTASPASRRLRPPHLPPPTSPPHVPMPGSAATRTVPSTTPRRHAPSGEPLAGGVAEAAPSSPGPAPTTPQYGQPAARLRLWPVRPAGA